MANVTLTDDECREQRLPAVCLRCGEPATTWVERTFVYYPGWAALFALYSVIGAAVEVWRRSGARTFTVPVCRRHRMHWANRTRWVVISTVAFVVVFGGSILYMSTIGKHDAGVEYLCFGSLFAIVAWLAVMVFFQVTVIKAIRMTGGEITLTQVHRGFKEALEEKRELDAEAARPEEWVIDENGPRKLDWAWDENGPRRQRKLNDDGPRADDE